jgi:hypothetical protein
LEKRAVEETFQAAIEGKKGQSYSVSMPQRCGLERPPFSLSEKSLENVLI